MVYQAVLAGKLALDRNIIKSGTIHGGGLYKYEAVFTAKWFIKQYSLGGWRWIEYYYIGRYSSKWSVQVLDIRQCVSELRIYVKVEVDVLGSRP